MSVSCDRTLSRRQERRYRIGKTPMPPVATCTVPVVRCNAAANGPDASRSSNTCQSTTGNGEGKDIGERIPNAFVKQIERMDGAFVAVGNGLYKGHLCGLPLHGVELREAYKTGPSERLLYMFTREFLHDHGPIKRLDMEERSMYRLLSEHVQQLGRNRATMDMKDLDIAVQSYDDAIADFVSMATPEQRLAGLAPEQVLLTLPDDVLRALSSDYIDTFSEATRTAIRKRIGR